MDYPIRVTSIERNQDGVYELPMDHEELEVKAVPVSHSVPCVGYVINEKPRKGKLKFLFFYFYCYVSFFFSFYYYIR